MLENALVASAAAALTLMALPEARFKRTNMVAVAVDFVFCVLPLMPAFLGTKRSNTTGTTDGSSPKVPFHQVMFGIRRDS